jgi:hypothetical protein
MNPRVCRVLLQFAMHGEAEAGPGDVMIPEFLEHPPMLKRTDIRYMLRYISPFLFEAAFVISDPEGLNFIFKCNGNHLRVAA